MGVNRSQSSNNELEKIHQRDRLEMLKAILDRNQGWITPLAAAVEPADCSKWPSNKAAASEEAQHTLRYVEPLSEARTKLADLLIGF